MGFIGSCADISEQKESEEKILKINSELAEINATKDKFFSIIAHDLRSPLSGLMQILLIMEEDFDSLEKIFFEQKPRLMFLCSPHNPVGRVWTREELQMQQSKVEFTFFIIFCMINYLPIGLRYFSGLDRCGVKK